MPVLLLSLATWVYVANVCQTYHTQLAVPYSTSNIQRFGSRIVGLNIRGTSTKSMQTVSQCHPYQKAPTLRPGLCASSNGIEPYSPNGESDLYSNTSRLYSRYGSDIVPLLPAAAHISFTLFLQLPAHSSFLGDAQCIVF